MPTTSSRSIVPIFLKSYLSQVKTAITALLKYVQFLSKRDYVTFGCMAWQIRLSVCRLWRACTLLRGFNFSGIFLHHIVAWPSGNSPNKNHEDRPRGSPPPRGLNRKGVVKQANLAYRRISYGWLSHLVVSFLLCNMNKELLLVPSRRRWRHWTEGRQKVHNDRRALSSHHWTPPTPAHINCKHPILAYTSLIKFQSFIYLFIYLLTAAASFTQRRVLGYTMSLTCACNTKLLYNECR